MIGDRISIRGLAVLCVAVPLIAACQRGPRPASAPEAGGEAEVNVGYGTVDRDNITMSVGTISGEELERQRVSRVEEMIQGRVSGVHVTQLSNGEFAIRIRGVGSPSSSNEPLVIIDGIQTSGSGALRAINPHDVARIEVLKDAGSLAIYGVRGANGVILVTTKRAP